MIYIIITKFDTKKKKKKKTLITFALIPINVTTPITIAGKDFVDLVWGNTIATLYQDQSG